jgi:phosphoribosylaminoimidazolecarboxamide formyltransferase/IMP cyclohydrolase
MILNVLKANKGTLSLECRFRLAQKAFEHTAAYDRTIADYLGAKTLAEVAGCY